MNTIQYIRQHQKKFYTFIFLVSTLLIQSNHVWAQVCDQDNSVICNSLTDQLRLFTLTSTDSTPNMFNFGIITGAELAIAYDSTPVMISGMSSQTPIGIRGGEYRINNGPFVSQTGTISPGDVLIIRLMSASSYGSETNAIINIWSAERRFSITTKANESIYGNYIPNPNILSPIDRCSSWDYSKSLYDGVCIDSIEWWNVSYPTFSGSFAVPPIRITRWNDIQSMDIQDNWAETYIIRLITRGIVLNTSYQPDADITRAEFLKIVIGATGWDIPNPNSTLWFDDIEIRNWYTRYIGVAIDKWLITTANMSFRPNYSITRGEAAKILIQSLGVNISQPTSLSFVDTDMTSDLTKYIEAAKYLNILSGQMVEWERFFRPNDPITRAEVAKMVVNAFSL